MNPMICRVGTLDMLAWVTSDQATQMPNDAAKNGNDGRQTVGHVRVGSSRGLDTKYHISLYKKSNAADDLQIIAGFGELI